MLRALSGSIRLFTIATAATIALPAAAQHGFDVDADGVDDYFVGYPLVSDGLPVLGTVRIISGATLDPILSLKGGAPDDLFGLRVNSAGDANNDGFDDILVSAIGSQTDGPSSGRVYVFSGATGDLLVTVHGSDYEFLGRDIAPLGDINGDGHDDFAASGFSYNSDGVATGFVRLFSGLDGAELETLTGQTDERSFGAVITSLGDFDADGDLDLAVSAPLAAEHTERDGAVYIFRGDATLTNTYPSTSATQADAVIWSFSDAIVIEYGVGIFPGNDENADGVREVVVASRALDATGEPELRYESVDVIALELAQSGSSLNGGTGGKLPGDQNGDLNVDIDDLIIALTLVSPDADPLDPFSGDLDRDGDVDEHDLFIISQNIGSQDALTELTPPDAGVGRVFLASGYPTAGELGCEMPGVPWAGIILPGPFGPDGEILEGFCCESPLGPDFPGIYWYPLWIPITDPEQICNGDVPFPQPPDNNGPGTPVSSPRLLLLLGIFLNQADGYDVDSVARVPREHGELWMSPEETFHIGMGEYTAGDDDDYGPVPPNNMSSAASLVSESRTGHDTRGPNQMTTCPVLVSEGVKAERDVDLSVQLPGEDFTLKRVYNGGRILDQPVFPWVIGRGWGVSVDGWITYKPGFVDIGTQYNIHGHELEVVNFPLEHSARFFRNENDHTKYDPIGPSDAFAFESTINIGGFTIPVWIVESSGEGQTAYFRTADHPDLFDVDGRILQKRDAFGNKWTYKYVTFDAEFAISEFPFLYEIYLHGETRENAKAVVHFEWDMTPDEPGEIPSGRVRRVSVERPYQGDWITTQYVEYTYTTDGIPEYVHMSPSSINLLLVERGQLLNAPFERGLQSFHPDDAVYHRTYSHFRYQGFEDRLSHVIESDQIEFFAERWAHDVGYTPADVAAAAAVDVLLTLQTPADLPALPGTTVGDLASKIIEYYGEGEVGLGVGELKGRVKTEYLQNGCACSPNGAQSTRLRYDYSRKTYAGDTYPVGDYDVPSARSLDVTEISEEIKDSDTGQWEVNKITRHYSLEEHFNFNAIEVATGNWVAALIEVPFVVANCIIDGADPTREHWSFHEFLEHQDVRSYMPDSIVTVNTDANGFLVFTDDPIEAFTFKQDEGLVEWRVFDGLGRQTVSGTQRGESGASFAETIVTYPSIPPHGRTDLPERIDQYDGLGQIESTDFTYATASIPGSVRGRVKHTTESVPLETTEQLGPGGAATSWMGYTPQGLLDWEIDATSSVTRYTYESGTGATRRVIRNDALPVNVPGAPSTTRSFDGGMLLTDAVHDIMGRPRAVYDEAGIGTHFLYNTERVTLDFDHDDADDTMRLSALEYLTVTSVPHLISPDGETLTAIAPALKQWATAELNLLRSSGYIAESPDLTSVGVVPVLTDWTAGEETSRATHHYDLSYLHDESRTWHALDRDAFYRDRFEYDELGRVSRELLADGSVTETTYDYEGRVKTISIGNEDQVVLSEEYFYDHALDGSTPRDGVGNGYLTLKRLHIDAQTTRDELTVFDWRGRDRLTYLTDDITSSNAIDGAYQAVTLDLLGRRIETATVGGGDLSAVIDAVTSDDFDALSLLLGTVPMQSFQRQTYSHRGLTVRAETEINPLTGTAGALVTRFVYDELGREIASIAPSGPVTKRQFDGLGREWRTAITDGASLRSGEAYETAVSPYNQNDTIFELSATFFDDRGLPEISSTSRKTSDGPGLGADPITTVTASLYDDAARPIAAIDYGVGLPVGSDLFASGGAPPAVAPSEIPERTPEIRVTETRYDERGRAHEHVDAEARVTRTVFDDLDRTVAVIQNHVPPSGDDLQIEWSEPLGIHTVTNRPTLNPDENRVTSTVYDAANREARRVAHLPAQGGDEHQITEFIYDPRDASLTGLGNLSPSIGPRYEIRYPDPDTGEPSTSPSDTVRFGYNLAGEQISTKDQNGVVRAFDRDLAGRLEVDRVVSGADANTVTDVTALVTEYDPFGRSQRLRSTTVSGGTVSGASSNELIYAYTPLGQVAQLTQIQTPTSSPMTVTLEWDTRPESAGNEDRRNAIVYPNNTRLDLAYGDPGSPDDLVDRVVGLWHTDPSETAGSVPHVEYEYMGYASVSRAHLAVPGVRMDRTLSRDGSSPVAAYPGWDRFGRLKLHTWVRGSFNIHASDPNAPSEPPLLQDAYTYDQNSNRLAKTDARYGAVVNNADWRFSYDGLDRLKAADRGKEELPAGDGLFAPAPGSRAWDLDAMGNWDTVRTDHDGDGDYIGPEDVIEARDHNMTNEYVDADRTTGAGGVPADPRIVRHHDDNGNLTRVLFENELGETTGGWRYRYDAWNRLSAIDKWIAGTWQAVAKHEYSPLHWRFRERLDASALIEGNIPDGTLERERLFAYSPEWQLLFESRDNDRGQFHTADITTEFHWGVRATDDAVSRRVDPTPGGGTGDEDWTFMVTDGLFSVVAELDASGDLRRRVTYDAYGQPTFHWPLDLNRDGVVDAADTARLTDVTSAGLPVDITDPAYNADADLAAPYGVIDQADVNAFSASYASQSITPSSIADPSGGAFTIGYAGYHFDELTGFWHARHRWYDPEAGRWLTRDPAGYVDGLSLYLYVGANPLGFYDPTGLSDVGFFEVLAQMPKALAQEAWGQLVVEPFEAVTSGDPLAIAEVAITLTPAGRAAKSIDRAIDSVDNMVDTARTADRINDSANAADNAGDAASAVNKANNVQEAGESATDAASKTGRGGVDPVNKGKEGVAISEQQAIERGETIVGKEVTFELQDGTRSRADLITRDENGINIIESKNGPNARMTENQEALKNAIENGEPVTPRGKNAKNAGLTPNEPLKDPAKYQVDKHNGCKL